MTNLLCISLCSGRNPVDKHTGNGLPTSVLVRSAEESALTRSSLICLNHAIWRNAALPKMGIGHSRSGVNGQPAVEMLFVEERHSLARGLLVVEAVLQSWTWTSCKAAILETAAP